MSGPMIRTLTVVAGVCGAMIVAAFQLTKPAIARNRAEMLEKAVFQVLPGAQQSAAFVVGPDGSLALARGPEQPGRRVYAGYDASGALVGAALEASGQGFQDVIRVLYGWSPEKEAVIGFKVLESKETPGLGDRIEKDPAFQENFRALDVRPDASGEGLLHAIEVVKPGARSEPWQIDAISGATISSKAVGKLLGRGAESDLPAVRRGLSKLREAP